MPAPIDGQRLRLILSAGRTGTVFLAGALDDSANGIRAVHEPWPARWELLAANLRTRLGAGDRVVAALLRQVRAWRIGRLPAATILVEINPLLSPAADLLAGLVAPLHVAHIVRDPADWAESIAGFGAKGWRRHVIDYVPFAKPYPRRRPPDWGRLPEVHRALWRWRFCNETIGGLAGRCASYRVVRFEDLFSSTPATRLAAMTEVRTALGLAADTGLAPPDISHRVNAGLASHTGPRRPDPAAVESVCGALARQYGYG